MALKGPEAVLPHPKSFSRRACIGMKFSNQEFLAGSHQLKRFWPIGAAVRLETYYW